MKRTLLCILLALSAALLAAASRVPAPHNVTAGESLWMPMDDASASAWVDDVAASNQNRKLNIGTTAGHTTTTAVSGTALSFSSNGADYFRLCSGNGAADARWLEDATRAGQPFTISIWVRCPHAMESSMRWAFHLYSSGGPGGLFWMGAATYTVGGNNYFLYRVAIAGNYYDVTATPGTWEGQWKHLVLVRSGTTVTPYVNGAAQTARTNAAYSGAMYVSAGSAGNVFDIGATGGEGKKCCVDDLRVYSRALLAAEVAALYNAGGGRTGPLPR